MSTASTGLTIKGLTTDSFWHFRSGSLPKGTVDPRSYTAAKNKFIELVSDPAKAPSDVVRAAFEKGYETSFDRMIAEKTANMVQKDALSAATVQPVTLLQDFTVKYSNADFMALGLFPLRPSPTEAGEYLEFIRGTEMFPQRQRGGNGTLESANNINNYRIERRPYQVRADHEEQNLGKDLVLAQGTSPINAMFMLRERVDFQLALRRELKVVDIVTDLNSYNASNRRVLTPGYHWDEPDADISEQIFRAKAALWNGEGQTMTVAWCSLPVWNVMRKSRNIARVLSASHQGFLTPEEFCEIFQVDALMVSEHRIPTSNLAESPTWSRTWGNHFGLMRVSMYSQREDASFGAMYRWMPQGVPNGIEANLWYNPQTGGFGAFHYKAALKETPIVVAKDTGYLFKDVLSPSTPLY